LPAKPKFGRFNIKKGYLQLSETGLHAATCAGELRLLGFCQFIFAPFFKAAFIFFTSAAIAA
jgi:hypothetical protein